MREYGYYLVQRPCFDLSGANIRSNLHVAAPVDVVHSASQTEGAGRLAAGHFFVGLE